MGPDKIINNGLFLNVGYDLLQREIAKPMNEIWTKERLSKQ